MRTLLGDPGFRLVLAVFLFDRLALELVGWVAALRVPGGTPPQPFPMPSTPLAVDMWVRWDSQWFLEIARRGYWLEGGSPLPQVFFPLYPLLMRAAGVLFGGRLPVAGLAVSNAAFLAGLGAFYLLVRERWGREAAVRAAAYLVLFPASFYFSAVYTEGLFFGLAAGAFLCAAGGRWPLAGLLGMGAALTRNSGVLLFPALVWEALRHPAGAPGAAGARRTGGRRSRGWLLLVPAGLALYMGYLAASTGDPLAFVRAEGRWGRALAPPWRALGQAAANALHPSPPPPHQPGRYVNAYRPWYSQLYSALDLAAFSLFAALGLAGWRLGVPAGQLLFHCTSLLLPLSAPALGSMTPLPSLWRYVAVLFPGFATLGLLGRHPLVDRAVWVVFPVLQGLFFLLFTTWNWIA